MGAVVAASVGLVVGLLVVVRLVVVGRRVVVLRVVVLRVVVVLLVVVRFVVFGTIPNPSWWALLCLSCDSVVVIM